MVIYIFRVIRGTSLCADELSLFIYSEVLGALLCADELWLFIYSEVLGALLSVLMSYGDLYIQRY